MDHRIRASLTSKWWGSLDLGKMKATIRHFEGDNEVFTEIPFKYEVCPTCKGTGVYVNPSIDSNGITEDEWDADWSEESKEDYINGMYDKPCDACDSENVIPIVDESRATQQEVNIYNSVINQKTEYAEELYLELKYGY